MIEKILILPMAGLSPTLPAGIMVKPILMCPFKNVPVVITTLLEWTLVPSSGKYFIYLFIQN